MPLVGAGDDYQDVEAMLREVYPPQDLPFDPLGLSLGVHFGQAYGHHPGTDGVHQHAPQVSAPVVVVHPRNEAPCAIPLTHIVHRHTFASSHPHAPTHSTAQPRT
jgi:hypothetical protein